jgi:predicted DNA-binding WGR domain protein
MSWQARVREVRYSAGNSHKFYRTYVMWNDTGEARLLYNWGRIGANGQFKAEPLAIGGSLQVAQNLANQKLSEKMGKGYLHEKDWSLPVVSEELLAKASVTVTANERSQAEERLKVDVFGRFAADADKVIRIVTGPSALTAEAVTLRSGLQEQLAELRRRLTEAEGQMELIDDVVAMKASA